MDAPYRKVMIDCSSRQCPMASVALPSFVNVMHAIDVSSECENRVALDFVSIMILLAEMVPSRWPN